MVQYDIYIYIYIYIYMSLGGWRLIHSLFILIVVQRGLPFLESKTISCLLQTTHNEKLNDLYSSPNIVRVQNLRRMRWAGHLARMGERRGVYRVLVGKPEGKSPLGRPRRRWEDNFKMDLQEVGCGGMEWIEMAQDRDTCECGNEPSGSKNAGNFLTSWKPVSFSRRTLLHVVSK